MDARCRIHGEFVLRSGQVAHEYFDKVPLRDRPSLASARRQTHGRLPASNADLLGGLELGGVPLATVLSSLTGIPTLFIRKTAKPYGTRRRAEGGDPLARTIVLVEDVITTGGAVLDAASTLRELGATVTTVVCTVDRSSPEANALAAHGISVRRP